MIDGVIDSVVADLARKSRLAVYFDDPVAWCEEVLKVELYSAQKEMLRSLATNKRTAVKSAHSRVLLWGWLLVGGLLLGGLIVWLFLLLRLMLR